MCEGEGLKNCFVFRYLGSLFSADGSEDKDVKRRVAMAVGRCGKLRHVMQSSHIPLVTKIKIYKCAVGSLFTYGSEAWCLSEKCKRRLNGANVGCLFRFTGKSRVEESRGSTCSYSLVKDIRRRRLIWLGHILRMEGSRLVKVAARVQWEMGMKGSLFSDAPNQMGFGELCVLAGERESWRSLVRGLN